MSLCVRVFVNVCPYTLTHTHARTHTHTHTHTQAMCVAAADAKRYVALFKRLLESAVNDTNFPDEDRQKKKSEKYSI